MREVLDHLPGVLAEVMSEIVQRTRCRQLFADLWAGRIGGVPPSPAETHEGAIAGVEAGEHFAAIAVLEQLESHVPVLGCGCHAAIVRRRSRHHKGTMAPMAAGVAAAPVNRP